MKPLKGKLNWSRIATAAFEKAVAYYERTGTAPGADDVELPEASTPIVTTVTPESEPIPTEVDTDALLRVERKLDLLLELLTPGKEKAEDIEKQEEPRSIAEDIESPPDKETPTEEAQDLVEVQGKMILRAVTPGSTSEADRLALETSDKTYLLRKPNQTPLSASVVSNFLNSIVLVTGYIQDNMIGVMSIAPAESEPKEEVPADKEEQPEAVTEMPPPPPRRV